VEQREEHNGTALRAEVILLRERCHAQQTQLSLRERMLDDLAASAGSGDAVTWRAKAELAQHDVVQLRAQLRARELEHQPVLERAIAERDTALDRGVELAKEMDQVRLIARASEGQLSRLSGALQLHVAEAEELASKLSDAHRRLGASIDRQVARSWVVNFVENYAGASRSPTASQRELLEMMAAWWLFSAEDRIRVGLDETSDALHTPHESLG